MANDLAKIKKTAYESFMTRIGSSVTDWMKVADVRFTDTNTLKLFDFYGGGVWSSQHATNDPSSTDFDSNASSTSYATYERLYKTKWVDVADNPELLTEIPQKLADEAMSTLAYLFWTTFKALDSTTHPGDSDGYTEAGAGTVYFADVFATPVDQANLMTTAFGATALATAKQMLRQYKDKAGLNLHLDISNPNLTLVVPPELEDHAKAVIARPGEIYDGSGLARGGHTGMQLVVSPEMTDANDWALVHRPSSPVIMWIRQKPQFEVEDQRYPGRFSWYGQLSAAAALKPFEGGVIFSKVA